MYIIDYTGRIVHDYTLLLASVFLFTPAQAVGSGGRMGGWVSTTFNVPRQFAAGSLRQAGTEIT